MLQDILGFPIEPDYDRKRDFIREQYRAAQDTAKKVGDLDLTKQLDVQIFHSLVSAFIAEINNARTTERTLLEAN